MDSLYRRGGHRAVSGVVDVEGLRLVEAVWSPPLTTTIKRWRGERRWRTLRSSTPTEGRARLSFSHAQHSQGCP
jgi:hypothetical protein